MCDDLLKIWDQPLRYDLNAGRIRVRVSKATKNIYFTERSSRYRKRLNGDSHSYQDKSSSWASGLEESVIAG